MASFTVENYIKTIYGLSQQVDGGVSTSSIAEAIGTKAATVSDMLRKLSDRKLINYVKYKGTSLTPKGRTMAIQIIRKHRMWESFLVEKLDFNWDEVHELAEELEHIDSDELVNRLEEFLGFPKFDPHGDPIPDRDGNIDRRNQQLLTELSEGERGAVTGVLDSSNDFLRYLDQMGIELGMTLEVKTVIEFDKSRQIEIEGRELSLSQQVCRNIYLTKRT